MKKRYTIEKSTKNSILLFTPSGGVLQSFELEIFPDIKVIRGACINVVKRLNEIDGIELQDATDIPHEVCAECGSIDVDIKCWVSEKDGNISKPEDVDDNDSYCNHCQKHVEVKQSDEDYIIYDSEKE